MKTTNRRDGHRDMKTSEMAVFLLRGPACARAGLSEAEARALTPGQRFRLDQIQLNSAVERIGLYRVELMRPQTRRRLRGLTARDNARATRARLPLLAAYPVP
jgi:hypothetical protein